METSLLRRLGWGFGSMGVAALCACRPSAPAKHVQTIDTSPLLIDGIYHSMDGPHERIDLDTRGLDWITGYRTEVIDDGSGKDLGDEFFCHSQLQLTNATRLLVTATGSSRIEFPEGFGMPLGRILSGVPRPEWRGTSVLGMVLNNFDASMKRATRIRATIEYVSDAEARDVGLKTLYKVELPMTVAPAPGEKVDAITAPNHCAMVAGIPAHWIVPPGMQVIRKRYSGIVPVEATVHFANAHLHNHGKKIVLRDLSADKILWQTEVEYEPARRQIARIPEYSSSKGFRLYPNHEYEIESIYENTDRSEVDGMAIVYLYYHPVHDEDITYPDPPPGI